MKKYQKIFLDLEQKIRSGLWNPSEQLPTEHQLCETYSVSRITASRALNELFKEGLVERHPGRGTFVKALSGTPSGIFYMLLLSMDHSNICELMNSFDDKLQENDRIGACAFSGFHNKRLVELTKKLEESKAAGICIHPSVYPSDHKHTMEIIRDTRLPVIAYYRQLTGFDGQQLVIDEEQCTAIATEHLISLGHKRLAFVGIDTSPKNISSHIRRTGFIKACKSNDLDPDLYPILLFNDPFKLQSLKKLFMNKNHPTGLIAASEYHAVLCCETLASFGLKIPDDVALVTLDGGTISASTDVPLTAVNFPMEAIGSAAAELMLAINRGELAPEAAKIKKFPGELIVRESCGGNKRFRHEYITNQLSKEIN
jgi:GntR family transcriptional regulator, arabinose operon transcriptional repressor